MAIKAPRLKHHFSAQTRPHLGPRVGPCIRNRLFRFRSRIMDSNVEPYRPSPVGFLFETEPSSFTWRKPETKAKNCYDQRAPMRKFQEIATSPILGFKISTHCVLPIPHMFSERTVNSVVAFRKSARLAQGPSPTPLILKVQFSETVRD
jgi:hypothetical protein